MCLSSRKRKRWRWMLSHDFEEEAEEEKEEEKTPDRTLWLLHTAKDICNLTRKAENMRLHASHQGLITFWTTLKETIQRTSRRCGAQARRFLWQSWRDFATRWAQSRTTWSVAWGPTRGLFGDSIRRYTCTLCGLVYNSRAVCLIFYLDVLFNWLLIDVYVLYRIILEWLRDPLR